MPEPLAGLVTSPLVARKLPGHVTWSIWDTRTEAPVMDERHRLLVFATYGKALAHCHQANKKIRSQSDGQTSTTSG